MSTKVYYIYLEDGFPMMALSSVLTVLNTANRVLKSDRYDWRVVSTADAASAETGIRIPSDIVISHDADLSQRDVDSPIVLLSNIEGNEAQRRHLVSWLRRGLAHGASVLSVGDAWRLLAEEGLLDGRRCAVHWRDYAVAVENFPEVYVRRTLFEADGPFLSCVGDISVFDLLLRQVGADFGLDLVDRIRDGVMRGRMIEAGERQTLPDRTRLERIGSPLLTLIDRMDDSLAEPLSIERLMRCSSLSRRQTERLFDKHMGMSPKKYYLRLRLDRARELLKYSALPLVEVAVATGFTCPSHFSKSFKAQFGLTPIQARLDARTQRPSR